MMDHKKLVYICSPFAGDIEQNTENARKYCRSAIENGAIPFAPHLLYPQFMDDSNPKERDLALSMGIEILKKCDELWVFGQKVSDGMRHEIDCAKRIGKPVKIVRDERHSHAQHWIPCSERMPEDRKSVLVYMPFFELITIAVWYGSAWFLQSKNRKTLKDAITHWMPLPEPPEGE